MIHDFLPVCREDMEKRGWEQCDFVYVSGDAYVDHPSFGPANGEKIVYHIYPHFCAHFNAV
jgi:hypothetical protein